MMAGRLRRLSCGLTGELVPVSRMGCWTSLGLHITTGSSSISGRGAGTGGGVGVIDFAKEERSQGLDRGEVVGRGFLYSFNRRGEARSGVEDPVGCRDLGDRDGMVIVSEGVGDALTTGVGHQNSDAAVVVWRVGEIPRFGGVVSPRAALVGFHVDENLHAEGSHGSSIEKEGAFKCFGGGEEGVLMTRAEHVECGIALFGEAAPVRNGEGLWEAGNARKEVIFPCAYRPFRRISAMHVRWSVLEVRLLSFDEFFNLVRCLVVHFV